DPLHSVRTGMGSSIFLSHYRGCMDDLGKPMSVRKGQGKPRSHKTALALLCLSALVLAGGITRVVTARNPKVRSASRVRLDTHHLAVVQYPTADGTGVATIDGEGLATACFEGSTDLGLLDLSGGAIIYTDHLEVLTVPLMTCTGAPKVLATYKGLTGHTAPM